MKLYVYCPSIYLAKLQAPKKHSFTYIYSQTCYIHTESLKAPVHAKKNKFTRANFCMDANSSCYFLPVIHPNDNPAKEILCRIVLVGMARKCLCEKAKKALPYDVLSEQMQNAECDGRKSTHNYI